MKMYCCLSVFLAGVFSAESAIVGVYVEGVSASSGWYDVNKVFDGTDDDMCWAAAASNMLHWWQDKQGTLPPGTPAGDATGRYSSNIFETFYDSFENDGGDESDGFVWWLTGDFDPEDYTPKPGAASAGYWSAVFPDAELLYEKVDLNEAYGAGQDVYSLFHAKMVGYVNAGCSMTFGIYDGTGEAHAVTMWGYEIDDESGLITSIYMTDSDDVDADGQPHMTEQLVTVGINEENNRIQMSDDYDGWFIGDVTFYSVRAIPEPASATLVVLGVFAVTLRRRRG